MPYKSEAQERWAHTPEGEKALGGASAVAEWDSASKGMKLPARSSTMHKAKQMHAKGHITTSAYNKIAAKAKVKPASADDEATGV
jgi:hypothetical protein